jgi:hypothetical protein
MAQPRRSARVQTGKVNAQSSHSVNVVGTRRAPGTTSQSNKRVKTSPALKDEDPVAGKQAVAKPARTKGKLAALPSMPLDILYEVRRRSAA